MVNEEQDTQADRLIGPLTAQEWRPIETAPKDTDVLAVADDGYLKINTARFHTYAYRAGGWWQWDLEYETRAIQPTHWMPLPSPPKENQ